MTEKGHPASAVFLSYAREDAEAARRIAEALRGFGVEVWFDLSELRGGDAWDAKIRRQIRECTLFIPIISATTQARDEGYFRREWKTATDRTQDMAESRAFIVPVIVDGTREADANVPEQFLRAHFTRLPGGEPTPQFVEHVKRLLQGPHATAGNKPAGPAALTAPAKSGFPVVPLALGLVISALVAFIALRPAAKPAPAQPPAAASGTAPAAPANPTDTSSIAVLPFVDMSQARDQEYFSDGLSEELLNLLAKMPQLRVIARTSSFSFKGKEVDVAEIARRLGVAHVLEGSVRKSGDHLRVTVQLIRAADSSHLWSETYDRQMTDIFAVQDEIAGAVVAALQVKLLPGQQATGSRRQTTNAEAYNLYLLGRQFYLRSTEEGYRLAVDNLTRAIAADPNYAPAHAWLARTLIYHSDYVSKSPAEIAAFLKQARTAAERAVELDPQLGDSYLARGFIREVNFDWRGALADHERALALDPQNAEVFSHCGRLRAQFGHLAEGIVLARRATAIDPLSAPAWRRLGQMLMADGQLEPGLAAVTRAVEIYPEYNLGLAAQSEGYLLAHRPAESLVIAGKIQDGWRLYTQAMALHDLGREKEWKQALEQSIKTWKTTGKYQIAEIYAWCGDPDQAFAWLDDAVSIHDGGFSLVAWDPLLVKLHGDPRWNALMKKVGLDGPPP